MKASDSYKIQVLIVPLVTNLAALHLLEKRSIGPADG